MLRHLKTHPQVNNEDNVDDPSEVRGEVRRNEGNK